MIPVRDNQLELLLLGRPLIRRNGEGLAQPPPLKSQALLFYLAVTGQPISREALAVLLWGEMAEAAARANLRVALSRLRKVVGDCLILDRRTVAFDFDRAAWVDTKVFVQTLHGGQAHAVDALRTATNLYRGDFLTGFSTQDAPEFEQWVVTEREWFHQLMLAALRTLLEAERTAGRTANAINVARRTLEIAPWYEEAHQELMVMLARTGQRSAALAQYEICQRILDEELGVQTSATTKALRAQIADGTLDGCDGHSSDVVVGLPQKGDNQAALESTRVRHAPDYPDPLLGRSEAIAQVQTLLANPTCRLLTLVGPGGIGKTRLALAAAATRTICYTHGAYFISFVGMQPAQPEDSTNLVVSAIGNALGYTFDAQQAPLTILLNYLSNKNLLLICDNFEQLKPAATLLNEIVLATPGVQIVVTSRERLGVRHEWLYEVEGLAFAAAASSPEGISPSASLFFSCARRVHANFDTAADVVHVNQICQILEGWPLSIELAAQWLRLLTCAAIAERLHDDVMLLDTVTATPDDRHCSMRAVLDASWNLLSAAEQRACSGVACFRGGFELNAAQSVVRAGLVQLGSLIDKSFLRCTTDGRYHMHEQVRQFALAHLYQSSDAARAIHRRHTAYYAALAAAQQTAPGSVPGAASIALFDRDLENLRLALDHALDENDIERVASLLDSLVPYFRFKGWNQEIVSAMKQACSLHSAPIALQARWQRWWSEALYHLGELSLSAQKIEGLMTWLGSPPPKTRSSLIWFLVRESARQAIHRVFPRAAFGRASSQRAMFVEAGLALERYGQIAWFLGNKTGHLVSTSSINWLESAGAVEFLAGSYSLLAVLLMSLAADRPAAHYYSLAMRFVDADTDIAHRSFTLEMCGFYCFCQGDWSTMQGLIGDALPLALQSARRRTSLELHLLLAISTCILGQYEAAVEQAAAVLQRARECGDVISQAWSLMIQIEACLHADADFRLRVLSLIGQMRALPSSQINRSEHFGIHSALAVIALRAGDECAEHELDRAQAIINDMEISISGAFESYANLFEVATALAESPGIASTARHRNAQRVENTCAILHKFARTHYFARPRSLIFDGIQQWQRGAHGKALRSWEKAAALAGSYSMRYDIARAHFEIGRHLADGERWQTLGADEHLRQAETIFMEIGAGYMLSRIEALRR